MVSDDRNTERSFGQPSVPEAPELPLEDSYWIIAFRASRRPFSSMSRITNENTRLGATGGASEVA
jgi:hypothetical protein